MLLCHKVGKVAAHFGFGEGVGRSVNAEEGE